MGRDPGAVLPGRTHSVRSVRGDLVGPFGDPSHRVHKWMPGGDTMLVVVTQHTPLPVTPAERDSVIAEVRASLRRRGVETEADWSTTVPAPFEHPLWLPPVVRGDAFWVVVTDELGVPYVVRARITPVK